MNIQARVNTDVTDSERVYNIFYDNVSGNPNRNLERTTCLNPFKDSIETRATVPPICLDYARGLCSRGVNCRRLHRLPIVCDEELPHSVDIFGRQRSALGPGSFLVRNNSIVFEKPANQQGLLTVCKYIGPVVEHSIGSVLTLQFKHRIYAEFTMEALRGQRLSTLSSIYNVPLSGDGLVFVDWAHTHLGTVPYESVLSLY